MIKIVLSLALLSAVATGLAGVLPPNALVDGKTTGEWMTETWQWVFSIPTNQNPQLDCAGTWANHQQPEGSVFFVAPLNLNTPPPCTRTFAVPEGKHLLMPLLSLTADNINTSIPNSADELIAIVLGVLKDPVELHASIDGIPIPDLEQYLAVGPVFGYAFPDADNTYTLAYGHSVVGLIDPIVVGGYWIMIEPLPPGRHIIRAGGTLRDAISYPHEIIAIVDVIPESTEAAIASLNTRLNQALTGGLQQSLGSLLRSAEKSVRAGHPWSALQKLSVVHKKLRAMRVDSSGAFVAELSAIINRLERELEPVKLF